MIASVQPQHEASACQWYAVNTRFKHEKKVHKLLQAKGVHSFLPLYSTLRYWSDRKKRVEEPLFSCYLFVKINLKEKLDVLQTNGVLSFVSFEHSPVSIPECQIETIQRLLSGNAEFEVKHHFKRGERVKVVSGPFAGMEGHLLRTKTASRLMIGIDALKQSIAVEIGAHELEPIK
ncbi:UpxY family transcription antiterminator [Flammeovirgaceae bacterium SG7u.111]|nr:UpxY family transcription antiterminator [Flammeovirgaceae bacterium SG7u.132]WPO36474.1 UpxY family transcription antiterminator [Flammeovirgaceae bacterium SG7u.111]